MIPIVFDPVWVQTAIRVAWENILQSALPAFNETSDGRLCTV